MLQTESSKEVNPIAIAIGSLAARARVAVVNDNMTDSESESVLVQLQTKLSEIGYHLERKTLLSRLLSNQEEITWLAQLVG